MTSVPHLNNPMVGWIILRDFIEVFFFTFTWSNTSIPTLNIELGTDNRPTGIRSITTLYAPPIYTARST